MSSLRPRTWVALVTSLLALTLVLTGLYEHFRFTKDSVGLPEWAAWWPWAGGFRWMLVAVCLAPAALRPEPFDESVVAVVLAALLAPCLATAWHAMGPNVDAAAAFNGVFMAGWMFVTATLLPALTLIALRATASVALGRLRR